MNANSSHPDYIVLDLDGKRQSVIPRTYTSLYSNHYWAGDPAWCQTCRVILEMHDGGYLLLHRSFEFACCGRYKSSQYVVYEHGRWLTPLEAADMLLVLGADLPTHLRELAFGAPAGPVRQTYADELPIDVLPSKETQSTPQLIDRKGGRCEVVTNTGQRYVFTKNQAGGIRVLWAAWRLGKPGVSEGEVLRGARSISDELRNVFRNRKDNKLYTHPAWETLIVQQEGDKKGYYRLNLPNPEAVSSKVASNPEAETSSLHKSLG